MIISALDRLNDPKNTLQVAIRSWWAENIIGRFDPASKFPFAFARLSLQR
ncbi:MAG: hypothetical protein ACLTQU_00895 [Enterococcus casseliflavus]